MRNRERERDLILGVMIFGEVGMVQGLSCGGSLVGVHVQQLSQQVHRGGVGSDKERHEVLPGVVRQGGDIAARRLVVDLVHESLVGSAADLDYPSEMLSIFAES